MNETQANARFHFIESYVSERETDRCTPSKTGWILNTLWKPAYFYSICEILWLK